MVKACLDRINYKNELATERVKLNFEHLLFCTDAITSMVTAEWLRYCLTGLRSPKEGLLYTVPSLGVWWMVTYEKAFSLTVPKLPNFLPDPKQIRPGPSLDD